MIKHNCLREMKFRWIRIDTTGINGDRIQCWVCGRIFEEIKLKGEQILEVI